MWLYILSFFSREQNHGNKWTQRGSCVAIHFPSVFLHLFSSIVQGFHKHILLSLRILLSLSVSYFFFLFPTLCLSLKAHCQDMVISFTMPVQAGSICSNGPSFGNVNVEWPPMVNILEDLRVYLKVCQRPECSQTH